MRAIDLKLGGKDHEELMQQFERQFKLDGCGTYISGSLDRESKELWKSSHVYKNGQVNQAFLVFRSGAAYGLVLGRSEV